MKSDKSWFWNEHKVEMFVWMRHSLTPRLQIYLHSRRERLRRNSQQRAAFIPEMRASSLLFHFCVFVGRRRRNSLARCRCSFLNCEATTHRQIFFLAQTHTMPRDAMHVLSFVAHAASSDEKEDFLWEFSSRKEFTLRLVMSTKKNPNDLCAPGILPFISQETWNLRDASNLIV